MCTLRNLSYRLELEMPPSRLMGLQELDSLLGCDSPSKQADYSCWGLRKKKKKKSWQDDQVRRMVLLMSVLGQYVLIRDRSSKGIYVCVCICVFVPLSRSGIRNEAFRSRTVQTALCAATNFTHLSISFLFFFCLLLILSISLLPCPVPPPVGWCGPCPRFHWES